MKAVPLMTKQRDDLDQALIAEKRDPQQVGILLVEPRRLSAKQKAKHWHCGKPDNGSAAGRRWRLAVAQYRL